MSPFRIFLIVLYSSAALIDLVAGIARISEGQGETGFLYLLLAFLFTSFALENITEGINERRGL